MAQFLGDIAAILEIAVIAAGLVLLHQAAQDAAARLLKFAGWGLVAGGVLVGLCTAYYWISYQATGQFDRICAECPAMTYEGGPWPGRMGPGPGRGMMGPGRMGPGAMGRGTAPPPERGAPPEEEPPQGEPK